MNTSLIADSFGVMGKMHSGFGTGHMLLFGLGILGALVLLKVLLK